MTSFLRHFSQLIFAFFLVLIPGASLAQAVIYAQFSPSTIVQGSVSTLNLTVINTTASPMSNLAFSATLPAGMTIGTDSQSNSCSSTATLTAPAGGMNITMTGDRLGVGSSCVFTLPVTSNTVGAHMLTTGDFTSSAGNSGSASATLTVNADTETTNFVKSINRSAVDPGSSARVSYSFDLMVASTTFTDWRSGRLTMTLPAGVEFSDPTTSTASCQGILTTDSDSGTLTFDGTAINTTGPHTCTVTTDIIGVTSGDYSLDSALTVRNGVNTPLQELAKSVDFTVNTPAADAVTLFKSFSTPQVNVGESLTLTFELTNTSRDGAATNISFSDDLNAMLSGLVATVLPADGFCGAGSTISGSSTLSISGATLGSGESCSFDVSLLVPAGAATGEYTNTTSAVTADLNGNPYTGSTASTTLRVLGDGGQALSFSKLFTDDPVTPGSSVTLRYIIANTNTVQAATDITFNDVISEITGAQDLSVNTTPVNGSSCGASSMFSSFADNFSNTTTFSFSGGELAANSSCFFDVILDVSAGIAPGSYASTTGQLAATVNGQTRTTSGASDSLTIGGGANLSFSKAFDTTSAASGATVDLTFTLTSAAESSTTVTDLTFTDDLSAFLAGTTFASLTSDSCGGTMTGTTTLSYSGGSIAPGASCSIVAAVTLGTGTGGTHTNTTSNLQATAYSAGDTVATPATASLQVINAQPLQVTQEIIPATALPGETVTLRTTLTNPDPTFDYTAVQFSESLSDALSGLATTGTLPTTPCGAGSAITGTTSLSVSGLEIAAGASCSFDISLLVPVAAANGSYNAVTSAINGTVNGGSVALPTSQASFAVSDTLLQLSKSYADSTTAPGGSVITTYELTNLSSTQALTSLTFTDDLDAQLSGLLSTSGTQNDICGTGSSFAGGSLLSFAGGSLAAGGSCSFSVTQQVPGGSSAGIYSGTTSDLSGDASGLAISGAAARVDLAVSVFELPSFSKSFGSASLGAGGSTTLTYVITNTDSSATFSGLRFTDDLDAALSGLTVTGGTGSNLCGAGSVVAFSGGEVSLTSGSLGVGESCSIALTVSVPGAAAAGSYPGSTSTLTESGSFAAAAVSATLTVEPAPGFAQAFSTTPIAQGGTSRLVFTIDNSASSIAANNLDMSNTLPAGLVVAPNPNPTITCTGGTGTAVPGSSVLSYTGGSLAAGATCTIAADVRALSSGVFVNASGSLTSSLGDSGTASDTLTVSAAPAPSFNKVFTDSTVVQGASTTLTFIIDNSGALIEAASLDFTDTLPMGLIVAATPNASSTCVGGTLTAAAETGSISYSGGTVPAGNSCTISADVRAIGAGPLVNTTGDLTSLLGNSGPASNVLTATAAPVPGFSKAFAADSVALNSGTTLTFTINNSGALIQAASLGFTDTLPMGLTVAGTPNASNTCVGGTLTAAANSGSISYSGGTVPAGSSCTISVDVQASAGGALVNTTGDLTSLLGNSGPASATLKVPTLSLDSPLETDDVVNGAEAPTTTISGTTSQIEDGQNVSIAVTDSASASVTGMASVTGGVWSLDLDLSALTDGALSVTADVSDLSGTAAPQASASLTLDTDAPALAFDSPLATDDIVSASEAGGVTISGSASGIEDGQSVSIVVTDSASASTSGTTTVNGNAWSLDFDLTALADGALSLTADAMDAAGNPVDQASTSLTLDLTAPAGYSASFDQDPINQTNAAAASFSFANAEVGTQYSYTISSDGGGSDVTGSGTIASATEQISALDLSGLGDGTLTLSVILTDSAAQAGAAATDTVSKDTNQPTATLSGPSDAQSDPFSVTMVFSQSVTGLAAEDLTIDNGVASGLTGSGSSYSVTVTPDHDGTVTISLPADSAQSASGNGNLASNEIEVTADLTGTPNPTPPTDSDGDGIPDSEEGTGDRDGDGIPDHLDYDPQGYFYCEDDGRILSGGGITVTGPSGSNSSVGIANGINIVRDGSTGEYQWFALSPGTYSVSYSYPSTGVASTTRLSSGTLDVTSLLPANPAFLGSSQVGSTGVLADASLGANPVFYDTFVIEAGDPDVLTNNIPMTLCQSNEITLSASDTGAEANGAATDSVSFTVSQDQVSAQDSVISYSLGGTATSGVDFTAPSGSVIIAAGATSALIDLPVLEDGLIEGTETVTLTLTAVTSAASGVALSTTAADLTGSTTLADDDFAVVAVTNDDLTASENGNDTAAMSFRLLGQPSQDVQLAFVGDAQCNVSPATLTFGSGNFASAQTLTITAINDDLVEGSHSCQPTVTVTSGDSAFDGFALALAQVTVTDDLVDQIREPLTEILKNDLEETVKTQQRYFSAIAKGALSRLRAGDEDLGCGTLASFDVDGTVNITGGQGQTDGNFGYDVYNCHTGSRRILDGAFNLTRTENIGTQALLQFSQQRERFLSSSDLRGQFWGGYLSRTNVTGLADGSINGIGVNAGLYGARQLGDGLFLDYYAAGAIGHHRYDLDFAATPAVIRADGSYDYLAAFAGVALSGEHQMDSLLITPRVGLDLAYALASDADVTATQLSQTDTGTIDIPDYDGARLFAEIEFSGFGNSANTTDPGSVSTRMALAPRLICESSSYDSSLGCGLGLAFSRDVFNPLTGLSYSFEIDYETIDETDRLRIDFQRERRFANDRGAVVTRLSMPTRDSLKIEHEMRLDF